MGRERPQPSHHGSPHTAVISHRVEMEAQRAGPAQVTTWTHSKPQFSHSVFHTSADAWFHSPFSSLGTQATSQAAETRERRAPKPREVR